MLSVQMVQYWSLGKVKNRYNISLCKQTLLKNFFCFIATAILPWSRQPLFCFVYLPCSPQERSSYCSPSLRCRLCLFKTFVVFILKTLQWSVHSTWNWLRNIRISYRFFSQLIPLSFTLLINLFMAKVINLKLIYYFLNYFCLSIPVESF